MDVKAMAKSKRSHSQHHSKKSYPKTTAKANVDVAVAKAEGNFKRVSGKNVVEKKPSHSRGAELPSNSDRYFDEDDLDTTDLLHDGASLRHRTDVVKPKSKGADYRYLISEARSQTHSTDYMDDILPDLNQGFGDMLSVSGEGILSWTAADYFIVEDKARPNYEASFLSLNLNTLNEQLAKVDLAQRLFIEPDVLPPELRPHNSEIKDDGKEPFLNSVENKPSQTDPGMSEFPQPPVKNESVLKEVVVTSSQVNDKDDDDMDDACLSGLKGQVKFSILPDSSKRDSSFEASQAEAELDMLLDSLGETDVQLSSQIPSVQRRSLAALRTSKTASGFDDAIDDLLSLNSKSKLTASGMDDDIDKLLNSTSNTKKTVSALDEGIDDLLDSASHMTILDNTLKSSNVVMVAADDINSASSSKAKLVDDLDAWLETL